MKTKRLTLRNVEITDAKLLAQWKNDPDLQEMSTGQKEFTTETEQTDITNNHDPYYILVINETNEPIGYIRINWLDEHATCAWLRFGLGPHRGQGYMKEALETLITTLFNQGVHRIESEIYDYNTPSQKLLQSLNFEHEAHVAKPTIKTELITMFIFLDESNVSLVQISKIISLM